MKKVFAQSAVIDHVENTLVIDGVSIPWYLAVPGPEVKKCDEVDMIELSLTVFIDGTVELRTEDDQHRIVDPVLGDVGEAARRQVRDEMQAAFPWLKAHCPFRDRSQE